MFCRETPQEFVSRDSHAVVHDFRLHACGWGVRYINPKNILVVLLIIVAGILGACSAPTLPHRALLYEHSGQKGSQAVKLLPEATFFTNTLGLETHTFPSLFLSSELYEKFFTTCDDQQLPLIQGEANTGLFYNPGVLYNPVGHYIYGVIVQVLMFASPRDAEAFYNAISPVRNFTCDKLFLVYFRQVVAKADYNIQQVSFKMLPKEAMGGFDVQSYGVEKTGSYLFGTTHLWFGFDAFWNSNYIVTLWSGTEGYSSNLVNAVSILNKLKNLT